jgi:hypothetical protein
VDSETISRIERNVLGRFSEIAIQKVKNALTRLEQSGAQNPDCIDFSVHNVYARDGGLFRTARPEAWLPTASSVLVTV